MTWLAFIVGGGFVEKLLLLTFSISWYLEYWGEIGATVKPSGVLIPINCERWSCLSYKLFLWEHFQWLALAVLVEMGITVVKPDSFGTFLWEQFGWCLDYHCKGWVATVSLQKLFSDWYLVLGEMGATVKPYIVCLEQSFETCILQISIGREQNLYFVWPYIICV